MDIASKKELALVFLNDLSKMQPNRLQQIIGETVGEELATIMFGYAKQVMNADPAKQMENASSLMILGYLIRVHEESGLPPQIPTA
ncbi:MAG: hypothetical protein JRF33_02140 [Deltaproteobacteria bacterium]|nr:hypothetical protein [Deltaproteobacteria bacterium]